MLVGPSSATIKLGLENQWKFYFLSENYRYNQSEVCKDNCSKVLCCYLFHQGVEMSQLYNVVTNKIITQNDHGSNKALYDYNKEQARLFFEELECSAYWRESHENGNFDASTQVDETEADEAEVDETEADEAEVDEIGQAIQAKISEAIQAKISEAIQAEVDKAKHPVLTSNFNKARQSWAEVESSCTGSDDELEEDEFDDIEVNNSLSSKEIAFLYKDGTLSLEEANNLLKLQV